MSRDTLLLVDDVEMNRAILHALFEQEYNLLEAENGEQALLLLNQYQDSIAALLLDIIMPGKNGYEVMAEMNRTGMISKIPVIIITAEGSIDSEVRAFDLGASDIIMKPFEPHVVKRRVQNAVELNLHREHLEDLVAKQAERLQKSRDVLMDALSSVIEHRNVESGQHVLRIRMFTKILLEEIMHAYPEYGLDALNVRTIASASALHDIGKISIPDAILNKPGPLTGEEFAIMKTHAEKGYEILKGLGPLDDPLFLHYAYQICRYHHERWDGRGYPEGLKGERIPICAQVVGIADAYDALTSDRAYKKAFSSEKAYNMILNAECGAFSPKLLECFKSVREQFVALSHSYADGRSPKEDAAKLAVAPPQQAEEQTTLRNGQLKYFAMLRYAGATVMEVDLDTGVFHLVYTASDDFDLMRCGSNYKESVFKFVREAVHPDDQEDAYAAIKAYRKLFVEEGQLKRVRRYRVLQRSTGNYVWYEATALRIDIQDPHSHEVLIVCKELPPEEQGLEATAPDEIPALQNLLVGVQQCVNDRYFTITKVNQGFLNLFGYSRQEIKTLFADRFIDMIHPDDRAKVRESLQAQLGRAKFLELEYRVVAKDGHAVWVLDKCRAATGADGSEYLNCVLMDLTQVKLAQEELRLTMERHQIILEQTNDIIFEWDMAKDSMAFSPNWDKTFGYPPISEGVSQRIPHASHIMPEDIPRFVELQQRVAAGSAYEEMEIRIANAAGHYVWCRIRATSQRDHSGAPIKAVGVISDIDDEKRRTRELIDKAERDALTTLYNKSAAQGKIQRLLRARSASERFAVMIIDIDSFKHINDTRGHMFGDVVLAEAASRLKTLFRSDDIVARIGGDEFLVFIRSAHDLKVIENRAAMVLSAFHETLAQELRDCPLSCSVGISLCPADGTDYQSLFQASDRALYYAKQQGKDRYAFYDKAGMQNPFGLPARELMAASTRIESEDSPDIITYSIVQQAFKVLYQAGDMEKAISSILEMVGRKYNVSRAYIFEDSEDGATCSNTFEWCNEGIEPEIDRLQNISYHADLGGVYLDNFDENGVFYCPDIKKLPGPQRRMLQAQGIRSMLQCAIRNDGKFVGYVGFDDCRGKRVWTQAQIDALSFVSELLSTFLLKKRAEDRALQTAEDLRMLLDNQNSWIYVIDPDTFVLNFINEKTYSIAPAARLGMRCFEAFFNREEPCALCPAYRIRQRINQTMEVFNPVLNVWSLADASFVHWGGKEACLLCCHDITPYKLEGGRGQSPGRGAPPAPTAGGPPQGGAAE